MPISKEIQKKESTPMVKFKDLVEKMKPELMEVLPKHLTSERMAKVLMIEAHNTPALLECSFKSIAQSVMLSAQIGLEPGGMLGHMYFIPFNDKRAGGKTCTPIIGYKGMLELARRSGQVKWLDARVVYQGEPFAVTAGLQPDITHVVRGEVDREDKNVVAAYAVVVLKDGGQYFEVLWKNDIDRIKKRSRGGRTGPWVDDYARMARKSAIRALFNGGAVPMSVEMATAIEIDGDNPHYNTDIIEATVSTSGSPTTAHASDGMDGLRTVLLNEEPAES